MEPAFLTFSDKALLLRNKPSNTHSIEELFSIPLKPSTRIITCVPDLVYRSRTYEWGDKLRNAFYEFKALEAQANAAGLHSYWRKKPVSTFDRFRHKVHVNLVRWGILI